MTTSPSRSLWWIRSPHDEASPRLEGDLGEVDVVVVGAGVVGLTVAMDLAEAGRDVVLLEGERVGAGATAHSSAKLTALQSPRYARLERDHGPRAAQLYARMTLDAAERVVVDVAGADGVGLAERTAVTWSADPDQREHLLAEAEAARRAGLAVREVEDGETDLPLAVGIALDGQHQYDTLAHLRLLRGRFLAAGGRLFEDSRVTGVGALGQHRTVRTADGRVAGAHVVVATGLPFLDRGLWFTRLEPRRSYAVALVTARQPRVMGLSVGGSTRSTRDAVLPEGTAVTIVTGGDHRTGSEPDATYDDLAQWGQEVFGHGPVVARWSAQDWRPADGLPLVGPLLPGDDQVLAAAGFDKWGLTSGTAAAGVLVDRVLGRPQDAVAELLDPFRLHLKAAGGELVRNTATVATRATTGWVKALTGTGADPEEGTGVVRREGVRPVAHAVVDGEHHRCLAICPHLGGMVAWDDQDKGWSCPLHGSRFGPDGAIRSGPTTRPLVALDSADTDADAADGADG